MVRILTVNSKKTEESMIKMPAKASIRCKTNAQQLIQNKPVFFWYLTLKYAFPVIYTVQY